MSHATTVSHEAVAQRHRTKPYSSSYMEHVCALRERRHARRRLLNAAALSLSDGLAWVIALCAAGLIRTLWLGDPLIPGWIALLYPAWLAGAAAMGLLPPWGLGSVQEVRRLTLLHVILYASLTVVLFVSGIGDTVSRLTITLAFLLNLPLVALLRLRVKRELIHRKRWGLPTIVYGAGQTGTQVLQFLQREGGIGFHPVGVLDDDETRHGTRIGGTPVLGSTDIVVTEATAAILAMPSAKRERMVELMEGPLSSYRVVLLIPDLFEIPSLWVRPRDLNGILGIEITRNLMSPMARLMKRCADILLVVLAAPMWVPLCAVAAAIIRLEDNGPLLFKQERVGVDGHIFQTLKFRTMVCDANAALERALAANPALRAEWESSFKLRHDPRITRIGRVLRRYSVDELPQLINVLRGDMSLVGPRPLPGYHHYTLPDQVIDLRERVRPGITGLWQVSGRSDAGTEGMETWDPYYVRNWSLWLDLVILFRTLRAVVEGKGAY